MKIRKSKTNFSIAPIKLLRSQTQVTKLPYKKYLTKINKDIKTNRSNKTAELNKDVFAIQKIFKKLFVNLNLNNYFLYATYMNEDEIFLKRMRNNSKNKNPFFLDKYIIVCLTIKIKISKFLSRIINNFYFELVSLLIIAINCFSIVMINTKSNKFKNYKNIFLKIEYFCFYFYTLELFVKIFALGIFFGKNTYFRDPWNFFDFVVIFPDIVAALMKNGNSILNIGFLRAIRVLKPLKTISKIKSLQLILLALFSAMPLLADSFLILIFFYFLFAIGGLQIFKGVLKKQCFIANLGIPNFEKIIYCGNIDCPGNQLLCGKMNENPNFGITNFDNIFFSFFNVFQLVTLDSWGFTSNIAQKTFSNYIIVYFLLIVILGGFFLVNLFLAVIKVKFSENHDNINSKIEKNKIIKKFDIRVLKSIGMLQKKKKNLIKKGSSSLIEFNNSPSLKIKIPVNQNPMNKRNIKGIFFIILKFISKLKNKVLSNKFEKISKKFSVNIDDYKKIKVEKLIIEIDHSTKINLENDVLKQKLFNII